MPAPTQRVPIIVVGSIDGASDPQSIRKPFALNEGQLLDCFHGVLGRETIVVSFVAGTDGRAHAVAASPPGPHAGCVQAAVESFTFPRLDSPATVTGLRIEFRPP